MTYTDVACDEILAESDMAFLCEFEDVGQIWLPKSQIEDAGDFNVGDKNIILHLATWLARQHNLE